MIRQELISFVERNYNTAPSHLKTALAYNKEIKDQPTQALKYFYDWYTKGRHNRSAFFEKGEYESLDNTD